MKCDYKLLVPICVVFYSCGNVKQINDGKRGDERDPQSVKEYIITSLQNRDLNQLETLLPLILGLDDESIVQIINQFREVFIFNPNPMTNESYVYFTSSCEK